MAKKIMLVEDDRNLREIYGARLLAEGYELVSAQDGEEALALAVKERPDLIISDVMMPKISGFDMLDILRSTPETKNTKVMMMTALSQPENKERADKFGADRYLVKSQVTLEDVAMVVKELLGDAPPPSTGQIDPAPATPVPVADTTPAQPADNSTSSDPVASDDPQVAPVVPASDPSLQDLPGLSFGAHASATDTPDDTTGLAAVDDQPTDQPEPPVTEPTTPLATAPSNPAASSLETSMVQGISQASAAPAAEEKAKLADHIEQTISQDMSSAPKAAPLIEPTEAGDITIELPTPAVEAVDSSSSELGGSFGKSVEPLNQKAKPDINALYEQELANEAALENNQPEETDSQPADQPTDDSTDPKAISL